jgi:hypothetical protein
MPYKADQARAIAASYRRRGKPIPEHVKHHIGAALRGKKVPKRRRRRKSGRSGSHALAAEIVKRRKKGRR